VFLPAPAVCLRILHKSRPAAAQPQTLHPGTTTLWSLIHTRTRRTSSDPTPAEPGRHPAVTHPETMNFLTSGYIHCKDDAQTKLFSAGRLAVWQFYSL